MDESILDRIPRLERSVRFWRNTSFILAVAREQAEVARRQAERALQEAKQKGRKD